MNEQRDYCEPKLNRREIKMFERALAGNKIIFKMFKYEGENFQNGLESSITFYVGRGKLTHQSCNKP